MANREHLKILKQGVQEWNVWREREFLIKPNLSRANLRDQLLYESHPTKQEGRDVAVIQPLNFSEVNLKKANLRDAILLGTDLSSADLRGANLRGASLVAVNFKHTDLTGVDFTNAHMVHIVFANNDLSTVKGLESITHTGPSFISIETLYKSGGRIPKSFLQDCGVPEEFIAYLPALIGAQQAIEFYSCFISYSHKDEEFAKRLHSRMRAANLRVWFAPEDIKGGEKLSEQIERAIQMHDRLLLVLSEYSIQSEWVMTEIRKARAVEVAEKRRKLFPIRLVSFEKIQAWKCFDADSGKDLATEVREYFIPDFSNWKNHDSFEEAFDKLLRDLKAEESK
jgi:uncharacterized protein YjbI with pentapeptide repeats